MYTCTSIILLKKNKQFSYKIKEPPDYVHFFILKLKILMLPPYIHICTRYNLFFRARLDFLSCI